MRRLNSNNFQKNPFVGNTQTSSLKQNKFSNYDKLGRKTVEEVKQGMIDVKYKDFKGRQERKTEVVKKEQPRNIPDFKNRINNLRNINRG